MCWRESVTIGVGQKHYSGTRCNMILHYSHIPLTCMYNSTAVFITQLTFFCVLTLLDSVGPLSLLHVVRWRELRRCFRLPTGSLDTERLHSSCRQLWLHSLWLRHQELHWQESSRVRDASSTHKGISINISTYSIWMNEVLSIVSCIQLGPARTANGKFISIAHFLQVWFSVIYIHKIKKKL